MNAKEIENILDIISYGVEWGDTCEDEQTYKAGSYETLGYIVACLICKRFGIESCATSDVVVHLKLHEYMDRAYRKELLLDFLKN